MVDIRDLPIDGKIKEKFVLYLEKNPLNTLHLGDFAKWEGGGTCAICGHSLSWSFRDMSPLGNRDIGICCGCNVLALQQCKGDFDALNFQRKLALEKRTIAKRQREFEKQQKAIELEIKYNDEFKFCTELTKRFYEDSDFQEMIGKRDNDFYSYAMGERQNQCLYKIKKAESFLVWIKKGKVSDYYLAELRKIMRESPEEIIKQIKILLKSIN